MYVYSVVYMMCVDNYMKKAFPNVCIIFIYSVYMMCRIFDVYMCV